VVEVLHSVKQNQVSQVLSAFGPTKRLCTSG